MSEHFLLKKKHINQKPLGSKWKPPPIFGLFSWVPHFGGWNISYTPNRKFDHTLLASWKGAWPQELNMKTALNNLGIVVWWKIAARFWEHLRRRIIEEHCSMHIDWSCRNFPSWITTTKQSSILSIPLCVKCKDQLSLVLVQVNLKWACQTCLHLSLANHPSWDATTAGCIGPGPCWKTPVGACHQPSPFRNKVRGHCDIPKCIA